MPSGFCCLSIGGRLVGSWHSVKQVPALETTPAKLQQPPPALGNPCPTPKRPRQVSGICWITFPASENQGPGTRPAAPRRSSLTHLCKFPGEPPSSWLPCTLLKSDSLDVAGPSPSRGTLVPATAGRTSGRGLGHLFTETQSPALTFPSPVHSRGPLQPPMRLSGQLP